MTSTRFGFGSWSAVAALLAGIVGCGPAGPPRGELFGEVTLDGGPVADGLILLVPLGAGVAGGAKGAVTGTRIVDGRYELAARQAAMVGRNRVEIYWEKPTGRSVPAVGIPTIGPQAVPERKEVVPVRYNKQSTLEVNVNAGRTRHDFRLDSTPH